MRGGQSAIHSIPTIFRRNSSSGTRALPRTRCGIHGSYVVLGSIPCRDIDVAETGRAHGLCRPVGDRPRPLRSTRPEAPGGAVCVVQVIAMPPQTVSRLVRRLLAALLRRLWGMHQPHCFVHFEHIQFCETPPNADLTISLKDWQAWGCRLRPFLLPPDVRETYREFADSPHSLSLGSVARVGIGYVTGANDFFHLRPSEAERAGVPDQYLHPCVRNGRCLAGQAINNSTVEAWRRRDEAILLLRLSRSDSLPISVKRYLDSAAGRTARLAYKCRSREPWYVVPDVSVPDAFLSYMSGVTPSLVANHAKCVGTNSVHVVKLNGTMDISELQDRWRQPLTQLSCELEGHPLGGGMSKLEPREAGKIVLSPKASPTKRQAAQVAEGLEIMRRWRHYGQSNRHLPMD